jgi:hypothetical protein
MVSITSEPEPEVLTVEWYVYGGLLPAGLILMAIDWRIMRKPDSQRSERERRYMARSRRIAKGYNRVAMKVLPWFMVGLGAVSLAVSIPIWISGRSELGWLFVGLGAVSVVAGLAFRWLFRRRRGPDFWSRLDEANRAADEKGYPRLVGSIRAGIAFGVLGILSGAGLLALGLVNESADPMTGRVMPVVAMLAGALFLFGSLAQRRHERQR